MDEYLRKAEECLKKADEENDVSDRYALLRKAEIYVRMAEVQARKKANIIADNHRNDLKVGLDYIGRVFDVRLKKL